MNRIKRKNIIIIVTVIAILVSLKVIIKPINQGAKKIEPVKINITESTKEWMERLDSKINEINKVAKENTITCDYEKVEGQTYIVSTENKLPVDNLIFRFFLNIIDENKTGELGRIIFDLKDGKNFDIKNYKFITVLINSITEEKSYDYTSFNEKMKDAIKNCKTVGKGEVVNEKIGEYNIKVETFIKRENNEQEFNFEIRRDYDLS
ncbi:hypothetical protein [Clostridium sp. 'White wine YQ']|uniref:hypothetical protein n=1 Tax=Clostridium sp. 'White wine YQ' TaxID=3027474 RepID=UPI0023659D91|nr:hypothetical protein [Clostridium sp. 'White wine YQ']MDD7796065.1 hypothetical protein [Clostridium sp. 'White wine YQ']